MEGGLFHFRNSVQTLSVYVLNLLIHVYNDSLAWVPNICIITLSCEIKKDGSNSVLM